MSAKHGRSDIHIPLDPIDCSMALAWTQLSREQWSLSASEAMALLTTLAGYTSYHDAARALGVATLTFKQLRVAVFKKMHAVSTGQVVARAWPHYVPLRSEMRMRLEAAKWKTGNSVTC